MKTYTDGKRFYNFTEEQLDNGPLGMGLKLVIKKDTDCFLCGTEFEAYDDTAIHLMNKHFWAYEYARLWLRGKVEEAFFNKGA